MNVKIFSLEGLHRTGKGTNLKLLVEKIRSETNYNVQVVRGDGSRPGKGSSDFYDPISLFWQNWQNMPNKSYEDWHKAYAILNLENATLLQKTEYLAEYQPQIILMDRCFISRSYLKLKSGLESDLINERKIAGMNPELIFLLEAPVDVLLNRSNDDNPLKAKFRRANIIEGYPFWKKTLGYVDNQLDKGLVEYIDATKSVLEVNNKIWNSLKEKL